MAEATGRELGQISLEEALAPTALVAERDPERRSRFAVRSVSPAARLLGVSVAMIDRTYGHYARDSEAGILARLNARAERSGVELVSPSSE